ncbi:hypothetical protein [Nocardia sp. BMG51109]|uniref:hypothetical protein n=1 Tax=Nocardia sp. BMG51109 TaxID=1056816 RepID=UPI000467E471|nr:hypothetical protein [Nocardia sp. BMG51109]
MFGRFGICVALAMGLAALPACTGAPDRSREVEQLEREISAMPGVKLFSANSENSFERGTYLDLEAEMTEASEDRIAAVVSRIDQIKGDGFGEYDQSAEFTVGHGLSVARSADLDPRQIADDARRLRQVTAAVPAAPDSEIKWFRNPSVADRMEADNLPRQDLLSALRPVLGDEAVRVRISSDRTAGDAVWTVNFPLSAERQDTVDHQVSALPLKALSLIVDDGHISRLTVRVDQWPEGVEDGLVRIVETIGPSPQHPLMLHWSTPSGQGLDGSVNVGACAYGQVSGDDPPEESLIPDAAELQKKLRSKYDTCPR